MPETPAHTASGPVTVRSYSKVNLGLGIGPIRSDGYHGLVTLYQTIEAHDLVTVDTRPIGHGPAEPGSGDRASAPRAPRVSLSSTDRRVPVDHRNTACKMATRLLAEPEFADAGRDVHIHIEKRLPIQGGLGGGSANAAAALIALEIKFGRRLSPDRRLALAAEIGSDVPLFLVGGAVLGLGRGEEVYPMPDLPSTPCVIALPDVGVSTPQAFREWDEIQAAATDPGPAGSPPPAAALTRPTLTQDENSSRLKGLSRALAASLCEPHSSGVFPAHGQEDLARNPLSALVRTGIENDFQSVVFRQHPFLATIERLLAGPDASAPSGSREPARQNPEDCALYSALSGSGSAVFGLYRTDAAADAAEARLRAVHVRLLRTRTLERAEYWEGMRIA